MRGGWDDTKIVMRNPIETLGTAKYWDWCPLKKSHFYTYFMRCHATKKLVPLSFVIIVIPTYGFSYLFVFVNSTLYNKYFHEQMINKVIKIYQKMKLTFLFFLLKTLRKVIGVSILLSIKSIYLPTNVHMMNQATGRH